MSDDYIKFPSDLYQLIPYLTTNTDPVGYPLVRSEFLNTNVLFDDGFGLVGVLDWFGAYTAPMEEFAIRTCNYMDWKSEDRVMKEYKLAVEREEGRSGSAGLGKVLGGPLGDLALAMWMHQRGKDGAGYGDVLERVCQRNIGYGGGKMQGE